MILFQNFQIKHNTESETLETQISMLNDKQWNRKAFTRLLKQKFHTFRGKIISLTDKMFPDGEDDADNLIKKRR